MLRSNWSVPDQIDIQSDNRNITGSTSSNFYRDVPTWEIYLNSDIETWSGFVVQSADAGMTYRSAVGNNYGNVL